MITKLFQTTFRSGQNWACSRDQKCPKVPVFHDCRTSLRKTCWCIAAVVGLLISCSRVVTAGVPLQWWGCWCRVHVLFLLVCRCSGGDVGGLRPAVGDGVDDPTSSPGGLQHVRRRLQPPARLCLRRTAGR